MTLIGQNEETENCIANALRIAEYARRFARRHWSFLGPGSEKKWYGTHAHKLDGDWDRTAEDVMLNFAESGHPIFRASSALERGELKSKGGGEKSTHYNGSGETVELILRTVISVTQLSFYGAAADLCKELDPETHQVQGNPPRMGSERVDSWKDEDRVFWM